MTRIFIDQEQLCLRADGHAGQDIVCAALSMLLYALADFGDFYGSTLKEDDGFMEISYPKKEDDYMLGAFDVICSGLCLLQQKYPKHVSITRADRKTFGD